MDDKTSESLNVRMSKIMTRSDLPFKTITADNGTEFYGYAQLEKHHNCFFTLQIHTTHGSEALMKTPMA